LEETFRMNKAKAKRNPQNNLLVGIIIAAVVVAVLLIGVNFAGLRPAGVTIDYANIPVTRAEDGAFVLGNPEADFTLVVFEDYNCGHCQSYEPTIKQFIKEYVETGLARFEYRNLRTASPSDTIFRVVQCAGEQQPQRFFEFREEMFNLVARSGWRDTTSPRQFAERIGVDYNQLLECAQTGANQVVTDERLARSARVTGTPFVLFRSASGELVPVPGQAPSFSQLKAFVDSQIGR
jgi:protein-disulfide isomerase